MADPLNKLFIANLNQVFGQHFHRYLRKYTFSCLRFQES